MERTVEQRMNAVRELLRRDDPDTLRAVDDVDPALLQWCREQSPRQRLQACTNAMRAVNRIRRASSTGR